MSSKKYTKKYIVNGRIYLSKPGHQGLTKPDANKKSKKLRGLSDVKSTRIIKDGSKYNVFVSLKKWPKW